MANPELPYPLFGRNGPEVPTGIPRPTSNRPLEIIIFFPFRARFNGGCGGGGDTTEAIIAQTEKILVRTAEIKQGLLDALNDRTEAMNKDGQRQRDDSDAAQVRAEKEKNFWTGH